jgi:hypothetical protein
MENNMIVRSLCLASALLLLGTPGWTQSPDSNSPEARACRGDAHRFCRDALPDEFRVASCLQEHRDRLSRACRAVLDGHGM